MSLFPKCRLTDGIAKTDILHPRAFHKRGPGCCVPRILQTALLLRSDARAAVLLVFSTFIRYGLNSTIRPEWMTPSFSRLWQYNLF
jgi:hypothetical protein